MKWHDPLLTGMCSLLLITVMGVACSTPGNDANSMLGKCPQPRFTDKAPVQIYNLTNPVANNESNINAGESLFQEATKPVPCMKCHGEKGDGLGAMANMFEPPPRNFRCAQTINGVPDGQLFWIIKNGSPGTSMPDFGQLSDAQIWQIVHYIRKLST